ncbi:MAG TPA: hydantoinase/oxoprolinase family protein [Solirubrobacteraceae bacterium]
MTGADGARLGVDVGGTFTDLVALVGGRVVTAKVPSTPDDQSEGVLQAVRAGDLDGVAAFAHGMTVATNALLERRGARTALVTNAGFRDVLEIGRQNRPHLYDLARDRPAGLIPRALRFTVAGRMGPEGELEPLDEAGLARAVEQLRDAEVEAVAVCFLFSFLHPEHERRAGEAIRQALPGVHVSLSCDVLPEFREYERFATTAADAYLAPKLARYLESLAAKARDGGVPAPRIMQSSGGVVDLSTAAALASGCVLSGPAGGVVGASFTGQASGYEDLLTFDMGGTSTDVAPIVGGEAQTTTDAVVAGIPIRHPMVDVHTVSAGGGSIARADAGGALRVGPRSAGAVPGPACYGRGGTEPTVTDADLFVGLLADGARLGGGEVVLRRELAEAALARAGEALGLDATATALGVIRVADAEMVRALRVVSVERGLDPRDFALSAFGGAGGMHACSLAEELGMRTVLVPRASGVLSALGLAISDLRRDFVAPLMGGLEDLDAGALDAGFAALEREAAAALPGAELTRRADARYRRQAFELTVEAGDPEALAERFQAAHEQRYGYAMPDEPVELVNLRLVAIAPVEKPALREDPAAGAAVTGRRRVHAAGEWQQVDVLDRERMGAGSEVAGPAIVEFPEATCYVRTGWRGRIDGAGTLVLERTA